MTAYERYAEASRRLTRAINGATETMLELSRALPPDQLVTCDQLADEGKWNKALCCDRCHDPEAFRLPSDPRWLPTPGLLAVTLTDSRTAELCCSAALTVKQGATA